MPVSVEVTLHGGGAEALLTRFRARASDFRPVFRGRFHDEVRAFFAKQWETEGAWGRMRWPPLSPVTLELRRRRGFTGTKPLDATGRFKRAFTEGGDVFDTGPLHYRLGSSWPVAPLHHLGFVLTHIFGKPLKTPRQVPARPVIPPGMPNKHVLARWEHVLLEYVLHGRT